MISGFCREVDENCALLGYYAAYDVNSDVSGQHIGPILRVSLPTFRENNWSYFKGFLTDVSGQPIGPILRVSLPTRGDNPLVLF